MRYVGPLFRPPSEADSLILQATIGCSHNLCTYCAMYRDKRFAIRDLDECLVDLQQAASHLGPRVHKLFVADGDSLILPMDHWRAILTSAYRLFGNLTRVSCYARSRNILDKSGRDLQELRELGLTLLYLGPESGDPVTLKRLVKGETAKEHGEAARRAHAAGLQLSVITLLGAGGVERSREHAEATADLITAMDPEFLSALTLMMVEDTPLARLEQRGGFTLPDIHGLLSELRTIVDRARPTNALFRTNHASNYLPLAGRLPQDRDRLLQLLDQALSGEIALKPEWLRGL
ncbi:MAG: radical SAM protein [Bradymonadales bacterium]|nr:radical SAM protein [Bradymonadales bacterium]